METVTEPKIYFRIAAALLALLALTVAMSFVNLGPFNVVLAMGIAVAKVLLVVLFFMEVRSNGHATQVMAVAGVLWLVLLVGGTLIDVATRVQVVLLPGG